MSFIKRSTFVGLALVSLFFSLSGCGGGKLTAEQVAAKVIESSNNLKSYRMEMTMTMSLEGTANGEKGKLALASTMKGEFDAIAQSLHASMHIKMDMEEPQKSSEEADSDLFFVDKTMYMQVPAHGGNQWIKAKIPYEEMNTSSVKDLVGLLKGVPVELLGEEDVSGQKAYVVKVTPDMAKLWELMAKNQSDLIPADIDVESFLKNAVKGFSVKIWISKDGLLPLKEEITMKLLMNRDTLGAAGGEDLEMTMDMRAEAAITDHNKAVSIVLPAGAKSAIEMPTGP